MLCGVPNYTRRMVFEGFESKESREKCSEEYRQKTGIKVVHVEQVPRGRYTLKLVMNYFAFVKNSMLEISRFVRWRLVIYPLYSTLCLVPAFTYCLDVCGPKVSKADSSKNISPYL